MYKSFVEYDTHQDPFCIFIKLSFKQWSDCRCDCSLFRFDSANIGLHRVSSCYDIPIRNPYKICFDLIGELTNKYVLQVKSCSLQKRRLILVSTG